MTDTVRGRVIYLLALVALVHFIPPMTIGGNMTALILYQLLYALMLLAGILVAGDSRLHRWITITTGLTWLFFSVLYALDPGNRWKILATYASLLPFQATLILVLVRYIFIQRVVDRQVLYAAITVFLLLGAVFVPIYGSLELLQPGSFVDGSYPDTPVFWQQLVYFSFVTLTTVGFGDILPVNPWARAVVNVEAVIGVLYIAILMARLVGLYSTDAGGNSPGVS
jgi:hypothetical protein